MLKRGYVQRGHCVNMCMGLLLASEWDSQPGYALYDWDHQWSFGLVERVCRLAWTGTHLTISAATHAELLENIILYSVPVEFSVVDRYSGSLLDEARDLAWRRSSVNSPVLLGSVNFPYGSVDPMPLAELEVQQHYRVCRVDRSPLWLDPLWSAPVPELYPQSYRHWRYRAWRLSQLRGLAWEQVRVRLDWLDLSDHKTQA